MTYKYGQRIRVEGRLSVSDPSKLESMTSIMQNAFRFGWDSVEISEDGCTKTVRGVTTWYPNLSNDAAKRLDDAPDGFTSGGLRVQGPD